MIFFFLAFSCTSMEAHQKTESKASPKILHVPTPQEKSFSAKLASAGAAIEDRSIIYDPSYVRLDYPGGDVPKNTGVCTDVIIRAYRKVGVDLQEKVYKDIQKKPSAYPNIKKPDTNIDHRRVPNLATFFTRNGTKIPVTKDPNNYKPGDIVWWKLGGPKGLNHIGLVLSQKNPFWNTTSHSQYWWWTNY
jgi:uncharacterized protein YijF (DUF1287 family)